MQVVHSLAVQFIDARLVLALREILGALLRNGDFFDPLAVVGSHCGFEDRLAAAFLGELRGAEVAQLVDQVLDAGVVHGLGAGQPLVAALGVGHGLELDLAGIAETEIEELLVAEIVQALVERVAQIGGHFVNAFDHGALGVVVLVLVSADFERLVCRRRR